MRRFEITNVLLVTVPLLCVLPPESILAQDGKAAVVEHIESNREKYGQVAQEIWDFAELGYMEEQSAALLESTLSNAGFHVETGVAAARIRAAKRKGVDECFTGRSPAMWAT